MCRKRVREESPRNDSIPAKRFPKASRPLVPARSPSSTQPWKEALQQCPRKEVRASAIYALGQQLALSEFLSFPICSPFPFLSRWYIPGVKVFFYSDILSFLVTRTYLFINEQRELWDHFYKSWKICFVDRNM